MVSSPTGNMSLQGCYSRPLENLTEICQSHYKLAKIWLDQWYFSPFPIPDTLAFQLEGCGDQNPQTGLAWAEVRSTEFACLHGEKAAFHLSDGNETRRQHNGSTYFLHFTCMPVCPHVKTNCPPTPPSVTFLTCVLMCDNCDLVPLTAFFFFLSSFF